LPPSIATQRVEAGRRAALTDGKFKPPVQADLIANIEAPEVLAKILSHLERTAPGQYQPELPLGARAPPVQSHLL
jgi:hypothetical protein